MEPFLTLPGVIGCGVFTLSRGGRAVCTPKRTVQYYEIELAMGSGGTVWLDGVEYKATPGMCIVAKPGQVRSSMGAYTCRYIHIQPESSSLCTVMDSLPAYLRPAEDSPLPQLFAEAVESASAVPYLHGEVRPLDEVHLRLYGTLLAIFALLLEEVRRVGERAYPPAVQAAIRYIEGVSDRFPDLAEVAGAVHLSPHYLHRLFRRCVGVPLHQYMVDWKLKEARRLLLTTTLSCAQISSRLGWPTPSYFNRVFRRECEMTPAEYRRRGTQEG